MMAACGSRRSAPQLDQHSLDSCQFFAYPPALSGESSQAAQCHGAELEEHALSEQSVSMQSFPEEEPTEPLVSGNVGKDVQRSDTSHRQCLDCLESSEEAASGPEYHRYFIEVLEVAHLAAELVVESPHQGHLGQHDLPLLPDIQQHQYHFGCPSYRPANSLIIPSLNSLSKPSRQSPLSPHLLTFSKQTLSNQPSLLVKALSEELNAASTLSTQASYCSSFWVSAHFRSYAQ